MGKKKSDIPEDVNKELESPKFGKPTEITASGYVLDINEKDGKVDIQTYEPISGTTILEGLSISKKIKTKQEKYDLAASFQKTIEEILYKKTKIAFKEFKKISKNKNNLFVIAGGVASNKKIRDCLKLLSREENFETMFPPINLCSDNAAMIALVGLEKFKKKQFDNLDFPAKPRWQLDENAAFLKGAGLKF